MTPKDNISAELMELSPLLAGIPKVNVFQVPDSYFETLGLDLLLAGPPGRNVFSGGLSAVPEDYFHNLAGHILDKVKVTSDVSQETLEISSLVAEIGNKNVLTVPTGYFYSLTESILDASRHAFDDEVNINIGAANKDNVYKAPRGYFDELSTKILVRIQTEEIFEMAAETSSISELVAGVGNVNVYSVPQDYFGTLAGAVLNKTLKQPEGGKLVTMQRRFTAWRYAAAAAIVGILGFSLFFMLNKDEPAQSTPTETMMAANEILKTNSFENELNSISDAAIVNFLEAKGEDVEAALVASLIDDKNLPDPTDYLIDDNTLDKILKTVDLSN